MLMRISDMIYICSHDVECSFILLAVFWGGREGFQTLLNTKVHAELSHMASFFRMAVSKLLLLLHF